MRSPGLLGLAKDLGDRRIRAGKPLYLYGRRDLQPR